MNHHPHPKHCRDLLSDIVQNLQHRRPTHGIQNISSLLLVQNQMIDLGEGISVEAVDGIIADAAGKDDRMVQWIVMQRIREVWIDGNLQRRCPEVLEATELYPNLVFELVASIIGRFQAPRFELYAPVERYIKAMG